MRYFCKFLLLIVTLLSFTQRASGKYIIVEPSKSIISQLKEENCAYEIRDNFSLGGQTLKIPSNCLLVFRGGSISGGSVMFNSTYLDGNVNIAIKQGGTVKGSIVNETIYTRWFNVKDDALFVLLNALLQDNSHKTYCIDAGTYIIKTPLTIRNVSEAVIDFRGAIIVDQTQGESALLHRPNPMIHIRTSHNIEIKNLDYRLSDNRYFSKTSTAVIWLGYGPNDWNSDIYNIRLSNITGKGNLVKSVKGGTSSNMLISGVGNMHNITLEDIVYDGDVASLINFEWGLLPSDTKTYKERGINLPNQYGIHPYNLTIRNVVGKNAPSSTGYLRLSSCYNAVIENCYGYNVNSFVMLYNGDFSISRVNGSAIVRNCASYINEDYSGKSLSGLLIFNTYIDPVSSKKHTGELAHNMSYIIENCEFQGIRGLSGCGIRVLGGDGNVVMTNVTMKNYTLGAKLSGAEGHNKTGGLAFYNCLFLNNTSSVELYSLDNCVFKGCIFRSDVSHNKNRIGNSQVAVYSGVNGFSLQDCVFEDNSKTNKAPFVTFEQKDNVKAVIENCSFTGSKADTPLVLPKTVSLSDCKIK